jgi:hypothetical protein
MSAGAVLAVCACGAAQCLIDSQQSCCNILSGNHPQTRGSCTNDPPGTTCSDIITVNPTVAYVYDATVGYKASVQFGFPALCKWQSRYCNESGYCAVCCVQVNSCYPSELVGPFQDCP